MSRRLGDDRTNVVQPIHPGHQRTLRFEAHVALLQMRIAGRNVGGLLTISWKRSPDSLKTSRFA